jgi:hypothetical protein
MNFTFVLARSIRTVLCLSSNISPDLLLSESLFRPVAAAVS